MTHGDFIDFDAHDAAYRTSKGKVRPAPELPDAPRVDTHCHLGMLADPALAIARAAYRGFGLLCSILDPGDLEGDPDDTPAAVCLERARGWCDAARGVVESWDAEGGSDAAGGISEGGTGPEGGCTGGSELPEIVFAAGVHPHNARFFDEARRDLERILDDERVTCVGEIGLDYHYDMSPRDVQRDVFARQLEIAQERGLPVQLHLREAHDDALGILRREGVPTAGCVLHCFNLDSRVLAPFLELGCHVAFGGPLTFKAAYDTRRASLTVPPERLLTETDAPFMAPEPLRGAVCTPDMTVFTLRMLLDCFGYGGPDAAEAALQPRPVDIERGAEPIDMSSIDFPALARGLDERSFAAQIFENALELLAL